MQVIKHLRELDTVSTIGLWGRSMGAVTALLHGDRDPSIGSIVVDSPFCSLRVLVCAPRPLSRASQTLNCARACGWTWMMGKGYTQGWSAGLVSRDQQTIPRRQ